MTTPSQRRKMGRAELDVFFEEHKEAINKANGKYNGPVWGLDNAFGELFYLGFMAGYKYKERGKVLAPWDFRSDARET